MKKVLLFVMMIGFMGVSNISCKEEKKEQGHNEHAVVYACPMECEGDKTYADKDTKCPVCKMKLVAKKSEHGGEGEHEDHKGHDKH